MDKTIEYYVTLPVSVLSREDINATQKIVYQYLFTFANTATEVYPSDKKIAENVGMSEATVERAIKVLIDKKLILIDRKERDEKGHWKRFIKIAKPEPQNVKTGASKTSKPEPQNDALLISNYYDQLLNQNIMAKSDNLTNRFNSLWDKYPRKQRKEDAFKAYKKAIKANTTDTEIEQGINSYLAYIRSEKIADKFVAQGGTWFSQQRWKDDYKIKQSLNNQDYSDYERMKT